MYKETLDILMEDINDHDNIKKQILKNQLEYHFTTKNKESVDRKNSGAIIVRRILNEFTLGDIIGIQPITNKENPTVVSGGINYEVDIVTRPLNIGIPDITDADLKIMDGINFEAETHQAVGHGVETGIVNEFLNLIAKYATEINIDVNGFDDIELVTATIEAAVIDTDANWIVISPMILAIVQSYKHSTYKVGDETPGTMGDLKNVGWLTIDDKEVQVYCSIWNSDIVLVGSKDPNREDTPIVYAPETMILSDTRESREGELSDITMLDTRYARFIHHYDCREKYRKITINLK